MAVVEVVPGFPVNALVGAEKAMGIASLLPSVADSVFAKPCQANAIPFTCSEVGHCVTDSDHQEKSSGFISEWERDWLELCEEQV